MTAGRGSDRYCASMIKQKRISVSVFQPVRWGRATSAASAQCGISLCISTPTWAMVRPPLPPGLSRWPLSLVFPYIVGCQLREFLPQRAQLLVVETIPGIQLLLELQQAGCGLGPCRVRGGGGLIGGWLAHLFVDPE